MHYNGRHTQEVERIIFALVAGLAFAAASPASNAVIGLTTASQFETPTTPNAMLFVIGGRMVYDGTPLTLRG